MTGNDIVQLLLYFGVLLLLAKPLGVYMARVYEGRPSGLDRLLGPVERFFYRICGINPEEEMGWKTYAGTLLVFSAAGLFFTYLLALLSFGIGMPNLGRLWRPLLVLGTTYILIAFGRDFVPAALDQKTQHWLYAAQYVPFALLSLIAIPLRLAAFLRQRFGLRSATA